MKLPKQFIHNVTTILGNKGSAWLDQLELVVQRLAQKWQLTDIKIFENLSYNYVARAYSARYASDVVLKICLPDDSFKQEKQALEYYDGKGCVTLLASDETHHAMLLEAIKPGISLKSLFPEHDAQAIEIAVQVMKQLYAKPLPTSHNFRTMHDWLSLFDTLEIPHELKKQVSRARDIAKKLRATQQSEYLLHGDLHHENILHGPDSVWKTIDPKGIVGEPAYEVGAFMCNPSELMQQPAVKKIISQRIDAFSTLLNIDRQRIIDACYVRIILSVCWTVQDKLDWQNNDDLLCAELIERLI